MTGMTKMTEMTLPYIEDVCVCACVTRGRAHTSPIPRNVISVISVMRAAPAGDRRLSCSGGDDK